VFGGSIDDLHQTVDVAAAFNNQAALRIDIMDRTYAGERLPMVGVGVVFPSSIAERRPTK
jgi:hypothetical protein